MVWVAELCSARVSTFKLLGHFESYKGVCKWRLRRSSFPNVFKSLRIAFVAGVERGTLVQPPTQARQRPVTGLKGHPLGTSISTRMATPKNPDLRGWGGRSDGCHRPCNLRGDRPDCLGQSVMIGYSNHGNYSG